VVIHQTRPESTWNFVWNSKTDCLPSQLHEANPVCPTLTITKAQLDECLEIIGDSLTILK
jgi:hypothetical protein